MKKLQNLVGAKALSKKEQQVVKGGVHARCLFHDDCAMNELCAGNGSPGGGVCVPAKWLQ